MTEENTIAEGEVILSEDRWGKSSELEAAQENPELIVEGDIYDDDGNLIEPSEGYASLGEQAAANAAKMRLSFQEIIKYVAEAHQKQLWRARRSAQTGEVFTSLVGYCQEQFQVGAVAARRYISAAKNFYIPLSEVTIEGTTLHITSGDVQKLGQQGLESAVQNIVSDLDGDETQEEVDEIVTERLSEAKAARDKREKAAESRQSGQDDGREFYEQPESDASGPVGYYLDDEDEEAMDYVKNPPQRSQVSPVGDEQSGGAEFPSASSPASMPGGGEDLVAPLLDGATRYDDDASMDELPRDARRALRAAKQIAALDVSELVGLIDYDHRGVLIHLREAQDKLVQVRAMAETQPWVLTRLED